MSFSLFFEAQISSTQTNYTWLESLEPNLADYVIFINLHQLVVAL
jgi:hypothetical protein